MTVYEGNLDAQGMRFGIVVSRFNEFITRRLLDAAMSEFTRHGVLPTDVDVAWVPGAFEVPLTCRRLASTRTVDAVIALACVLQGETPHFDYVAQELTRGVASVALECDVPVIYGAITAHTLEQAIHRAGGKFGNKGMDAARAAIEMAALSRQLGMAHEEVKSRIRLLNSHA